MEDCRVQIQNQMIKLKLVKTRMQISNGVSERLDCFLVAYVLFQGDHGRVETLGLPLPLKRKEFPKKGDQTLLADLSLEWSISVGGSSTHLHV